MKIGFTGHRDKTCDIRILEKLADKYPSATWVHGGADGFDAQVAAVATAKGIAQSVIRPEYGRYSSKTAPIMRNKEIVEACDHLVACYDGRKVGGTYQTIKYAERRGKTIFKILPAAHPHTATPTVTQGALF